jgi:hypothetical protein
MKKKLMQILFPKENVKWVFVRAELERVPLNVTQRLIVTCKTLSPGRIYRSSLAVDGVDIGSLYFIGIRK